MKVFLTGGTGFIGSRVAKALIDDGHQVTALSRRTGTDLEKLGVKVIQGSLQDLDTIAAAAVEADAVLHLPFDNDLSKYAASNLQDLAVIKTLNKALAGSGKSLLALPAQLWLVILERTWQTSQNQHRGLGQLQKLLV